MRLQDDTGLSFPRRARTDRPRRCGTRLDESRDTAYFRKQVNDERAECRWNQVRWGETRQLIRVEGRGGWIELIMALHSVLKLSYALITGWRRIGVLW
jgi:hypothetical protein